MSDFIILCLIGVLVVSLVLTLLGLVFYSGLLSEVVIRTGSPPVKQITIAYKFKKGSYKESGAAFTESCSIAPKLCSIGVYYDDPNQTQADCCRYAVGSILSEDEEKPDEELQRLYEKFGFRVISFPEVSCAVTSSFPNRCPLSPICGAYRVFPELNAYVTERRLSAYPFLEICKGDLIHYMCPLENQESFFVPELLEKETRDEEEPKEAEADAEEDNKGDEVTETGESCWVESSVEIQEAGVSGAESREAVEDPPAEQQSAEQDEGDGHSEEADQEAKGSSESLGSGSSFEELDMDMEEAEKENTDGEKEQLGDNEEKA
ncbi:testis-expressed protein 264 homolog [Astyanax mexicanus]|uniref:Testis-expressed protein 264-like n=1 Tax=Astyanax mexicanus TaxID=7994 RepID=A0A8B9KS19_ASTMX|nr:testis-expressed protein 264 homolog [Astyanax mexicanus]KAG9277105.1 testis-expressed protein 264-like [Astyanax mexicanus]